MLPVSACCAAMATATKKQRMERLTIQADKELIKWLKEKARKDDAPVSFVARQALKRAANRK